MDETSYLRARGFDAPTRGARRAARLRSAVFPKGVLTRAREEVGGIEATRRWRALRAPGEDEVAGDCAVETA
jgi:hypothetical protein